MKIILLIGLAVILAGAGAFFFLAQKSKAGAAPGLIDGALAPCPSSPNCVSSEPGTPDSHAVAALPAEAWEKIPDTLDRHGARLVEVREDYVAAEFSSKLMGYVDDIEFRKTETDVQVRSASRVGYGDMGANRKRVEALRAALAE